MSISRCWNDLRITPRTLLALAVAVAICSLNVSWSSTSTPRSFSRLLSGSLVTVLSSGFIMKYVPSDFVRPSFMVLHFCGWKTSSQSSDHFCRLVRSRWMDSVSSCVSLRAYSFVSSANIFTLLFTARGISLMYMTKSVGPSTLPCGIPLVTGAGDDAFPFTRTHCDLPLRNALIH